MLLMLAGCGLTALAIGVGIGLFIGKRAQAGEAHGRNTSKRRHHDKAPVQTIYSLGEQVVNLADTSTLRYAKFTLAIGFEEKISEEKVKEYEPVLRDIAIGVVTKKRFQDLHRKGGLKRLKEEIRAVATNRITDATIGEVFLEQFAMQ
jgi:flagellar basal body-associated protein FliL